MKQGQTISDFLIMDLDIDFNEITVDFIRELPFEIQKETFFKGNNTADHISEYFSVGERVMYHGEDVEIRSIDNNFVIVYKDSINELIEISATEILNQNSYLDNNVEYVYETDIDFTSDKFKEIQNKIIEYINDSNLNKNDSKDAIINNIETSILDALKDEYINMI